MRKGVFASDPRGLIFESYNMSQISEAECRSIFLDWALGLEPKYDPIEEIRAYLNFYENTHSDHPMNKVLQEGLNVKPRGGLRRRKNTKELNN